MSYRADFTDLHGYAPYSYQERVAASLRAGENVFLRAPTGSGKTKAVLTPFLLGDWPHKPRRLIYALPLRSLVQQIHAEAAALLAARGLDPNEATIQTGEQPDDALFDRGRIIITTYDQVLSGLLCAPYGLSRRQANINAAAVASALVVFDEFHLMGLDTALLTGAAGLRLFDRMTQSVWMSATATTAPAGLLAQALGCEEISLSPAEMETLPIVKTTRRELRFENVPLTAKAVEQHASKRTIVILNQVDRAMQLFRDLRPWAAQQGVPCVLLHSRFFKRERARQLAALTDLFGPGSSGQAILIATQVVEAGLNVSCDRLLTELCPMNALLQRSGRCARFEQETGVVHVYALPTEERAWLPYGDLHGSDPAIDATQRVVAAATCWTMSPQLAQGWVETVHGAADAGVLRSGYQGRLDKVKRVVRDHFTGADSHRASDEIRPDDGSTVRLIVARPEELPKHPGRREALSVSRFRVAHLLKDDEATIGWYWGADGPWSPLRSWSELRHAYVVALPPELAGYSREEGLRLGEAGSDVSPDAPPPRLRRPRPLVRERWTDHARAVTEEIERRWDEDGGADGMVANGIRVLDPSKRAIDLVPEALKQALRACGLLHDTAKLRLDWQAWAEAYQRDRDPSWSHVPLAHTDYDASDPVDQERSRRVRPVRGNHAAESAGLALLVLARLLPTTPAEGRARLASACLAAIVGHHGGWLGETLDLRLASGWHTPIADVTGLPLAATDSSKLGRAPRATLASHLDATLHPDNVGAHWALVAYLTRQLRLSDQRATGLGGWYG